jgi:hypothetical protein
VTRGEFEIAGLWSATLTFDRFSPAILPLLASEEQLQILRRWAPQDDSAWGRVNCAGLKSADCALDSSLRDCGRLTGPMTYLRPLGANSE